MAISIQNSIIPMSELRMNLRKVKAQLRKTPVIITNKGKADFGVCDLETLTIATQIRDLRHLLKKRLQKIGDSTPATEVFAALEQKYRDG